MTLLGRAGGKKDAHVAATTPTPPTRTAGCGAFSMGETERGLYLRALNADDVHQQAAMARMIELYEEDALPLAQHQPALDYRYRLAAAQEEVLTVGVAVGALLLVHVHGAPPEVVMAVFLFAGRPLVQHLLEVFQQQGLIFRC